ncbi:hypothetical protein Tco_0370489 [Tanacetum coccineum]
MDKCKIGLRYNAVPPPYTGNFMPQKSDLVYPSLDDLVDVNESVSESIVEKPTGTRVNTARPKAVLSAVKGNKGNVVKASTCWVWRPKHKILDHGNLQIIKKMIEDLLPLEELKFNLFSVSQMCDKKNSVLFTDTECVVLSPSFKLTNESHVLLKVPRKDNMYSVDLKNVIP